VRQTVKLDSSSCICVSAVCQPCGWPSRHLALTEAAPVRLWLGQDLGGTESRSAACCCCSEAPPRTGCSRGCSSLLNRRRLLRRQGSARRLAAPQHPRRGRPHLGEVQQPKLIGDMAGMAPPLTVCLSPTRAQASRTPDPGGRYTCICDTSGQSAVPGPILLDRVIGRRTAPPLAGGRPLVPGEAEGAAGRGCVGLGSSQAALGGSHAPDAGATAPWRRGDRS
jgi:hypothetical protein